MQLSSFPGFTVPLSPTSVPMVASIGATFMYVMWNTLDCDKQNGPITSYNVEYAAGDTSLTASVNSTLYNLTDLVPCTNYSIRVEAENEVGIGSFLNSVSAITKATGQLQGKECCHSCTCIRICACVDFWPFGE